MPVFFNGRLWTSPATMSRVDDSSMYNTNLSVGNVLAVIGTSEGGEPFKALRFGSAAEARATLRAGPMLKAIEKAFDPSGQTAGPSTVVGIRINPALPSSLTLKDGAAADVITLKSTDYGLYSNGIKVKIEAGSAAGFKLTTQFGNSYYSADNVARNALSLTYTGGEATATFSITATALTLAPAALAPIVIDLAAYPTVLSLVDRINGEPGFAAAVLDGHGEKPTLNGLDAQAAVALKSVTKTITGNLQEIVDWFNSTGEGFITAERIAGAATVPVYTPFTYLAGGTNGSVTTAEWQKAFDALQTVDVQWVVPLTSLSAIHAMADAHVSFMSNVGRMERRCIVGTASATTDESAIQAAKNLNSDRTSLVHLGFYDYDENGKLKLFEPYVLAALLAGAFSGVNPGTALTNKSIKVSGLERKLRNPTDTDNLITGGVLCVEDTVKGYKVVKSVTTWLTNNNYNHVEVSTGVALDFVSRNVRSALDDLQGAKRSPSLLSEAVSRTDSTLRALATPEPLGPGVLAGDKTNPAYKNIIASMEGDVVRVEFECSPVIPANFIIAVIHAVPFSGKSA